MLNYNDIRERKYIIHDGEPYEVLSSQVSRKQKQKPVNQTKLKNLLSGSVIEHTFHQSDKAHEADIDKKTVKFLYSNRGEIWFADPNNPKDRFQLPDAVAGEVPSFVTENSEVNALVFTNREGDEQIIGIKLPIKVELKVTEAPPAVKGNTASGGDKKVILETGLTVTTPLFINEGDIVRVNTETGDYVERAEKQ